ncbi:glycosyltransferase family 2 protein [Palleronia sp. LCG004]|uniref:glycosyltransferase family 2 protein n=1 Tax=Palleronia sp. LCG004 TaxID=3079304 RepID=UPI002943A895|nr:glycosyltransferase family 2 protein [Palleronia sp. LCG004]WOI58414.1 glycosyltransferase family 2 protein [Palleronia sp. LCG004]
MTYSAGGGIVVAIVSYGTSELVLQALPALQEELSHFPRARTFVVDNASPDNDGEALARGIAAMDGTGPEITFLPSPINGGFAAGNNVAFAAIRGMEWQPEAILLLNPDAEVRPGSIREMLRVMRETPEAGFVGPRVENPDGSSWIGAFNFPSMAGEIYGQLGLDILARRARSTIPDSDVPVRADWVTGTAVLIRHETFKDLGDMDDGYFLYYEEVDYMLQGARAGWQSWHAPDARVVHIAGAATGVQDRTVRKGRMPAYWFQAWARYFAKNHGAGYARATALGRIGAVWLGDLQRRLRGKGSPRPEGYLRDFAARVAFARLSPPPVSDRARIPGGGYRPS